VDAAREYSGNYTQNVYSVMKAFGLSSRAPGEIEKKYITKWFNEYGFDADIVVEACNRTLQTIHKPNFEYADTILKKWKQNNVVHLRDIAVLDQLHASKKQSGKSAGAVCGSANKFNNYPQRTYDFNQLEKILQTK
jgi:DnaD/phage-associated family protein